MLESECLQRVERRGLAIGNLLIPAPFFRHGQPGRRFAVFPEEMGRLTHVRKNDMNSIMEAYRSHVAKPEQPKARPHTRARRLQLPDEERIGRTGPEVGIQPAIESEELPPCANEWELMRLEETELTRANELAHRLAALKTTLTDCCYVGTHESMLRLQREHEVHFRRCMALRARLNDLGRGCRGNDGMFDGEGSGPE